jgi:SMC interacting uncharacterized protein involved in chromosome segregation
MEILRAELKMSNLKINELQRKIENDQIQHNKQQETILLENVSFKQTIEEVRNQLLERVEAMEGDSKQFSETVKQLESKINALQNKQLRRDMKSHQRSMETRLDVQEQQTDLLKALTIKIGINDDFRVYSSKLALSEISYHPAMSINQSQFRVHVKNTLTWESPDLVSI